MIVWILIVAICTSFATSLANRSAITPTDIQQQLERRNLGQYDSYQRPEQRNFDHHFTPKAMKLHGPASKAVHPPLPSTELEKYPSIEEINVIAFPINDTTTQKKEHFAIYSTSDRNYFKTFLKTEGDQIWSDFTYIYPTTQYARRFNYSYLPHPDTFRYDQYIMRGKPVFAHFYRIYAALQLMQNEAKGYQGPPIDWVVYIDTDAFIAEPQFPLEAIVDAAKVFSSRSNTNQSEVPEECHFITQEHGAIANSGFFMIRNSEWSIKFFKRWLEECEKRATDPKVMIKWVWDQGPLQNAILHEAAELRNMPYHDECWHKPSDHEANVCWNDLMVDRFGAVLGQRQVGKICMLPRSLGIPFFHHYHHDCVPGKLVCHQKDLTGEQIAKLSRLISTKADSPHSKSASGGHQDNNFGLVVGYNFHSKYLVLRANTLVYIKRFLSPLTTLKNNKNGKSGRLLRANPNTPRHSAPLRGPYHPYEALFYWIDKHNQPQRIYFILHQHNSSNAISLKITGRYSFYLDHHIVPSPIKELLDIAAKSIQQDRRNKELPPMEMVEVSDASFLQPISPLQLNRTILVSNEHYSSLKSHMII